MGIPKISVVMSVYNGEEYLEKGVNSILYQTFSDFEFIICDDCSTDGTYNKLKKIASKDSRVILIHNETNCGLAFSLNKCILMSKSNILARQDADDESVLTRFEKQYDYVIKHPEYAIVGTSYYSVRDKEETKVYPKENPLAKDLIWDGGFMHPSWMMRKDMLQKVGFYTATKMTRRDQDYHLVMKLYGAGMIMHNMQELLYRYTNDIHTYNRTRNLYSVKGLMWIRWDGYRRNNFPCFVYIVCLKPLIKNILPNFLMKKYYYRKK